MSNVYCLLSAGRKWLVFLHCVCLTHFVFFLNMLIPLSLNVSKPISFHIIISFSLSHCTWVLKKIQNLTVKFVKGLRHVPYEAALQRCIYSLYFPAKPGWCQHSSLMRGAKPTGWLSYIGSMFIADGQRTKDIRNMVNRVRFVLPVFGHAVKYCCVQSPGSIRQWCVRFRTLSHRWRGAGGLQHHPSLACAPK